MIRVINQATESQGRTENSIRANQVYCQLYRMNYESIRPNIGSTSETCVSQVLDSYVGSYRQLYRPKLPGTLQHLRLAQFNTHTFSTTSNSDCQSPFST